MQSLKSLALAVLTKLLAQKIALLVGSLSPIAIGVAFFLRTYIAPYLVDTTGLIVLLWITVSAVLLIILISTFIWFRPKFKHLKRFGVHENIKTGEYFCAPCFITKKLESPLKTIGQNQAWHCVCCSNTEKNPDYIESTRPRVRISAGI